MKTLLMCDQALEANGRRLKREQLQISKHSDSLRQHKIDKSTTPGHALDDNAGNVEIQPASTSASSSEEGRERVLNKKSITE